MIPIFTPIEYFQFNLINSLVNSWLQSHFYERKFDDWHCKRNEYTWTGGIWLTLKLLLHIQLNSQNELKQKLKIRQQQQQHQQQQPKTAMLRSWRTLFNCFHSLHTLTSIMFSTLFYFFTIALI